MLMQDIFVGVVIAIFSALIGLLTYKYRNKVIYDIETIVVNVVAERSIIDLESCEDRNTRQLNAERLTLTNKGFRTLNNVEFHIPSSNKPSSVEIGDPTTLSKNAISAIGENNLLRVKLDTFPPNETIAVSYISLGWREHYGRQVRGTGGNYKVIKKVHHDLNGRLISEVWLALTFFIIGLSVMYYLR